MEPLFFFNQEVAELFTKSELSNFIHYSIADDLVNAQKAYDDQARYLTVQNGLYDLIEHKIIDHTPDIFTTNLLPYDYDPEASCPKWLQYLDEVFLSDKDSITFVQEAIGYSFYKKMPTPAVFFLVGSGSNGKSVFINTLSSLCGDENVSNISLNLLTNEIYLLDLFGKMINVSSETPNKKFVNTDLVKAVTAGDYVTGRELYKKPFKFKSFAKHFLAMNKLPNIDDNTHGMWRRIYVINFPRKFEESEMDRKLTEKLKQELSGLFNWALEGYERLKTRDFSFNESESMRNSKKQYKAQSNSVFDFIEICLQGSGPEDSISFKDAYEGNQAFCASEGHRKPYPKKEFREILEGEGYAVKNCTRHANQVRVFGLKNAEVAVV